MVGSISEVVRNIDMNDLGSALPAVGAAIGGAVTEATSGNMAAGVVFGAAAGELIRRILPRHGIVYEAVPVVMSDKHGFLGISAAAYYRVWFDTENNSQTLFSGSKDSAWQRFNELKAQCSCSPSEPRNLMAHVEIAPTDGFPIVLGQPVREVPHERVAEGRPCELRPRVPSESEAASSAVPLTLFAGRLDEGETEPEDEDCLIFSRGAAQDAQAAGAEMCAAAVAHADSDEEPLLFSRGAGRTQR